MAYLWLFFSAACSVAASVMLKSGSLVAAGGDRSASFSGMLLPYAVAVGFYGLGFVSYAVALRRLELSLAYPLMVAISIAGMLAYGILRGNEAVTVSRIVGATCIALGVFILNRQ